MDVLRFPWMRDLIRRDDGSNRVPGHVRHVGGDRPGRGPPISLGSAPYVGRGVTEARAFEAAHRETGSRCAWAEPDPLLMEYHDSEWGVPQHDDRTLFEFLILDGAQAGLSWLTILRKREAYRKAFLGFDPTIVASFDSREVRRLLADPGIVRNRLKIASAIRNARSILDIRKEFGSFDAYLWRFVQGRPRTNRWKSLRQIPASTGESDALSAELKTRGFSFVGSTICYAFMQAAGMVNDHLVSCFRYAEVSRLP